MVRGSEGTEYEGASCTNLAVRGFPTGERSVRSTASTNWYYYLTDQDGLEDWLATMVLSSTMRMPNNIQMDDRTTIKLRISIAFQSCARTLFALSLSALITATSGAGVFDIIWQRGGKGYSTHFATFSPDGSFLWTGDSSSIGKIWKTADMSLLRTVAPSSNNTLPAPKADFAEDGKSFLVCGTFEIYIYDTHTWQRKRTFRVPSVNNVWSAKFFQNDEYIAAVTYSSQPLRIIRVSDGQQTAAYPCDPNSHSVDVSTDDQLVAVQGSYNTQVLRASDGSIVSSFSKSPAIYSGMKFEVATHHLTTIANSEVYRNDADSGTELLNFYIGPLISTSCFNHWGTELLVSQSDRSVKTYSLSDGALITASQLASQPSCIALSRDETTIFVENSEFGTYSYPLFTDRLSVFDNVGGISCKFSRDGEYVASRNLRVFNSANGALVSSPSVGTYNDFLFSSDATQLFVVGDSPRIRVFDTASGNFQFQITTPGTTATSAELSSDGTRLLTASGSSSTVYLTTWDVGTWAAIDTVQLAFGTGRVSLSADERYCATAAGSYVRLVDLNSHQLLWSTSVSSEGGNSISGLDFSPNGARVCCVTNNGVVSILRVADGAIVKQVDWLGGVPGTGANSVKYINGGRSIIAGGVLSSLLFLNAESLALQRSISEDLGYTGNFFDYHDVTQRIAVTRNDDAVLVAGPLLKTAFPIQR